MPSWLKRITKKGNRAGKKDQENGCAPIENVEFESDGGFNFGRKSPTKQTYKDGIAPVVIQIDEADEENDTHADFYQEQHRQEPQKSRQSVKGKSSFLQKKSKTVGNGDLIGTVSDLDFCCFRDGICLGFSDEDACGEDQTIETVADFGTNNKGSVRVSVDSQNQSKGKSRSSNPADSGELDDDFRNTISNRFSRTLDSIRCMGPIRDRKQIFNVQKGRQLFARNRLKILIALVCFLLLLLIAIIVQVVKQRQVRSGNSVPKATSWRSNSRKREMKNILALNSDSDWETEGSPQSMALNWLANDDPAALPVNDTPEIELTERFAAATLYFATGGQQYWTESFGFLSGASICEWNTDIDGESVGILCESGRVKELKIVDNNLQGSLPKELNYFDELVILQLYYNRITGTIPDISSLTAMEELDLDGNDLTGLVPEAIFNMPNMAYLFLLNNKGLTGTIPELGDSSKFVALSILGCSFGGTIPQSLTSVSTLRLLQLKDNEIEGSIPSELFSLPSLETLGLDSNRFVGRIPTIKVNKRGSALKSLSVGSNSLEGPLPDGIDQLTSLQYLYADDNILTGSIPGAIFELPSLEQLWLQDNKLTGDISDFSFRSNAISDVYLGENDFSGYLHDIFRSAPSSIQRLGVSGNNRLKGYISDDISSFDSLKYFNASSCSLGGTLPSDALKDLTEVYTFAVGGNQLGGRIPSSIGKMTSLESLDLSENTFTGDVPREMANLVSLTSFDISVNRNLGGDLTSTVCRAIGDDLVFAMSDCFGNDPVRVECDCCTDCCNREGQCVHRIIL